MLRLFIIFATGCLLSLGSLGSVQADPVGQILNLIIQGATRGNPQEPHRPRDRRPSAEPRRQNSEDQLTQSEMSELQRALTSLGYDVGEIDGRSGRRTGKAIESFLQKQGIDPYKIEIGEAFRLIVQASSGQAAQGNANRTAASNNSPAGLSANAEAARIVRNGDFGMPFRDQALLMLTSTNYALRQKLSGDAKEYVRAVDRLGRLLILAGNAALLEEPAATHFFLPLVEPDRLAPFLEKTEAGPGGYDMRSWKGTNQFARDDSRKAFISAFRDELVSKVPKLPLRVDFVRGVSFGAYDGTSLAMAIDGDSPFPYFSSIGLTAPEPFQRPDRWAMTAQRARQILEGASQEQYNGPVVVTRAEVTGVRPDRTGVILDIAAIDMSVYASTDMTVKLGDIPLPDGAVLSKLADTGVIEMDGTPKGAPFDPILVRMLASKVRPDFTQTDGFRQETFRMRRAAEDRYRSRNRRPAVDWPFIVAPSLLKTNATPSIADLASVDKWFTSGNEGLNGTLVVANFCGFDPSRTACIWPNDSRKPDGSLSLIPLVKTALSTWDYGWNGLPEYAGNVAAQRYPGSTDAVAFGAGRDLPGMVMLKPHPAWYGIDVPNVAITDAAISVSVTSQEILGTPSGKGFIAVEIEPKAFHFRSNGRWQSVSIGSADSYGAAEQSAPRFDILGVKLGMPLDEASKILAATFEGRTVEQIEVVHRSGQDPLFGEADPILGRSFAFQSPPATSQGYLGESPGAESIKLFYDSQKTEKPLIAIGRSVRFDETSNDSQRAAAGARPVFDSLVAKYGKPDRSADLTNIYTASLWAAQPVAKRRIASGDKYCDIDSEFASTFRRDGGLRSGLIQQNCGEILSIWLRNGVVSQFIADTTRITALRGMYAKEIAKAAAEKEANKPKLKF